MNQKHTNAHTRTHKKRRIKMQCKICENEQDKMDWRASFICQACCRMELNFLITIFCSATRLVNTFQLLCWRWKKAAAPMHTNRDGTFVVTSHVILQWHKHNHKLTIMKPICVCVWVSVCNSYFGSKDNLKMKIILNGRQHI